MLTLGKKSFEVLQYHIKVTLKDIDGEQSFQLAGIQVVYLIVHFAC